MKLDMICCTAFELAEKMYKGLIIHDPVGQRPPVTQKSDKSIQIIESLLTYLGIGTLILRDIRNEPEMQKLYPGAEYIVIDGGHRLRALLRYFNDKLRVFGSFYSMQEKFDLKDYKVWCDIRTCTSAQASKIYAAVNRASPQNTWELLMSNEESQNARFIREITMAVKEYGNQPKEIFSVDTDEFDISSGRYIKMSKGPNAGRKWDSLMLMFTVSLIKSFDDRVLQEDVDDFVNKDEPFTNAVKKAVYKFCDDLHKIALVKPNKRITIQEIDGFMTMWIYWYHKESKDFKITDYKRFYKDWKKTYSALTGNRYSEYDNETIVSKADGNIRFLVKDFWKKKMKNRYAPAVTKYQLAEIFMKDFDQSHIVFRDNKRSLSSNDKEDLLAAQDFRCAIDGKPLEIDDAVFAHDTPWSQGGKSEFGNGAIVRVQHNRDMGTLTLDEYRKVLEATNE